MKKTKRDSEKYIELYKYCLHGGNLAKIKEEISENDYSIPELEHAIHVLEKHVTSALENNIAQESVSFLDKIIEEKKMLKK